MKCKKCHAKLEKDAKICPACGEAVPEKPAKKGKLRKTILISTASVVLAASLAIVIYWGVTGVTNFKEGVQALQDLFISRKNDYTCRDSYSVSDKRAQKRKDVVVAAAGDEKLTNGELQVYYWMNVYDFLSNYGYYAVYAGLDFTQPLDEQTCLEEDCTWQQFFLEDALGNWHRYQAMALMARDANMKLTPTMQNDLDDLRARATEQALEGGYTSIDAMIQADMGPGCNYDDYYSYMETYYLGYMYFNSKYEKVEVTDEMLEDYFTANEQTLKENNITKDSGKYYDVRHILIAPDGGKTDDEGNVTYTEEEWEACQKKAQELLDEWLEGEHTEETFAELANEHSEDTGSNKNGGLYTELHKDTEFVKPFKDWYLEEDRKAGDYGLVKSDHGYHIMYFSASEDQWRAQCRTAILKEASNEIMETATKTYPLNVDYSKIVLGVVELKQEQ